MALLNSSIPSFKALVKRSYFTKDSADTDYYNVYVFGCQSLSGKILTFHVMTDDGMMRSRVPLSDIYFKQGADIPFYFKQLWDCFSESFSVTKYEFLVSHRAEVVLRDGTKVWAEYMFTVDWFDNPYSDEPSDYKCGHIMKSDDGYLLCMPNNRILWKDSNWVTKTLPNNLKQFKVDTELLSVENVADRWVSVEDSDSFYYEFTK